MNNENFSRRHFLKQSALSSGMVAMGPAAIISRGTEKLPREVWIAGISQMDMRTDTPEEMLGEFLRIAEEGMALKPDILCLPETFPVVNTAKQLDLSAMLDHSGKALEAFSKLAVKHGCYVICPVYTSEDGRNYNAAVVFDRNGKKLGEYRKMHITIGEIESGLTPGPLEPPLFNADFGKFGIQICYDIYWNDGWEKLADLGSEIVFWPSAFAAGDRISMKALENQYAVVSCTRKNTSRICDKMGEVITETGLWGSNFFCSAINLEKVLVDSWPHFSHFQEILNKYGRKVRITTRHEEQFSVIESLSPDVFVADILKEFGIQSYRQEVKEAQEAQIRARNS